MMARGLVVMVLGRSQVGMIHFHSPNLFRRLNCDLFNCDQVLIHFSLVSGFHFDGHDSSEGIPTNDHGGK